jgi:hypothetical protein
MSTKYGPELGEESRCRACGYPVKFNGRFWEHIGPRFRHIPDPVPPTRPEPDPREASRA